MNVCNSSNSNNEHIITNIHNVLIIDNIDVYKIFAFTCISDNRIAIGLTEGTICICKVNYNNHKWKCIIKKSQAHDSMIWSFCEITIYNILISSSDVVHPIKVWKLLHNDLSLILSINESELVNKVVTLNDKVSFISCCDNATVSIWNVSSSDVLLERQSVFNEKKSAIIICVLQLSGSKGMVYVVSCLYGNSGYVSFWNGDTKEKETIVFDLYTENHHGMIELNTNSNCNGNGNGSMCCIAVSMKDDVVIFDVERYVVVRRICDREVINGAGVLSLLNEKTFVYVNKGCFCQINVGVNENGNNSNDNNILFKVRTEYDFWGWGGIGYDSERKYIIVDNYKGNLLIFLIEYLINQ